MKLLKLTNRSQYMVMVFACLLVAGQKSSGQEGSGPGQTVKSQDSTSKKWRTDSNVRGFRFSLIRDSLTGELITKHDRKQIDDSGTITQDIGFSAGYQILKARGFGFRTQMVYNRYNSDTSGLRLDIGLNLSITPIVSLYLGSNVHKFLQYDQDSEPEYLQNLVPGSQAGIGLQFTDMIGIDISYLTFRNSGEFKTRSPIGRRIRVGEVDFQAQGMEAALHLTF